MENKTNDTIRYVAFRLFLEKGYEATNIRDICKEVNIKAPSLYFYYKSKQELFYSIYDDIWNEKIAWSKRTVEAKKDITSDMKLYHLYKNRMEYYAQNIVKQKFLMRYLLFPPEELTLSIREKYKYWSNQEHKTLLDIISQSLDCKAMKCFQGYEDYLEKYMRFESLQVIEMIISNIKISDAEIDACWSRFWNSTMLRCM